MKSMGFMSFLDECKKFQQQWELYCDRTIIVNKIPMQIIREINSIIHNIFSNRFITKADRMSEKFHQIGNGSFGRVFDVYGYAVKVFTTEEEKEKDDPINLFRLQGSKFFPKLYAYEPSVYMISEKIDGKTIRDLCRGDNLSPLWREQIHEAYLFVQSRGLNIIDVNSGNVMVTKEGDIKFVDVGRYGFKTYRDYDNPEECISNIEYYCNKVNAPKIKWERFSGDFKIMDNNGKVICEFDGEGRIERKRDMVVEN